ncbi:ADYC domain-containing protein [Sorangium sp. So ce861]|uniref:ADYC domain-containing protein n=1 Tax=Sorangium sp. So ce861 TaxID=3133323 RepID=UPI003F648671
MSGKCTSAILVIGAVSLAACAPAEPQRDEAIGSSSFAVTRLNGLHVNGLTSNGLAATGISAEGMSADDDAIEGITVDGAELVAGSTRGGDFAGSALVASFLDGSTVALRIESAVQSPSDPDFWLYELSYRDGDHAVSACGEGEDGAARPAIALAGRWDPSTGTATGGDWIDDPSQLTLACLDSALAKCAMAGYKPWQTVEECDGAGDCRSLSLRPFHQACTRMIRADYCGDGQPHTRNGVPVNIWDNVAIQTPELTGAGWAKNAEWSPEGAVCIDTLRYDPDGATSAYIAAHCPERQSASFSCFGAQSTFFTENGTSVSVEERSLLRNEHDAAYVSGLR